MMDESLALYIREKELYYCGYEFKKDINVELILKFLILLDRFYPDFLLSSEYGSSYSNWQEFALRGAIIPEKKNTFYFRVPLYVQRKRKIELIKFSNSFKFSFVPKVKKGKASQLLFDLYADLVTDNVYIFKSGKYIMEDQSIAAKKNREILSDCLREIEELLEGEIVEYITDYHLTSDSIYKYGIKEDARHITDHID